MNDYDSYDFDGEDNRTEVSASSNFNELIKWKKKNLPIS